ncbi:MAG: hypothetical protein R2709_02260 [Marmoricola sp.]
MSDRQYTAITKAARETTAAFMDVDYTDMEPRIEQVLAGEQRGVSKISIHEHPLS